MKERLDKTMLIASKAFRKCAVNGKADDNSTAAWIYDNYYILEVCAKQSAQDCKRIMKTKKGPEKFPGLLDLCRKICQNALLPDEKELAALLPDLNCFETEHLALALTAVTVENAYKAHREKDIKTLSNAVETLHKISATDFEWICQNVSKTEKLLNADPSGVYPELDEAAKSEYRRAVSENSARKGVSEEEYVAEILIKSKENAKHIGEYIFSHKKRPRNGKLLLFLELIMPLLMAFLSAFFSGSVLTGIILIAPFWKIFRFFVDRTVIQTSKPERLLRLDSSSRKVADINALITVSTLLPLPEKMQKLEEHLEKLYLSNGAGNIKVCCLADFKSSPTPSKPEDKAAVRAAMQAVDRLNSKYSGGFILALRPREYSSTQGEFTGKERKRGAITELVNAIKGNSGGFSVIYGDKSGLAKVKYLIALDADTELDFDAAKELIAVAEHPLNRPVISRKKGRVISGYGIIAPRAENKINYSDCTLFEIIMAGSNGVSVYDSLCVEKYQALFSESIFCGKGIIDVEAYDSLLKDLPPEQILSHDIIEGGYLRAGFASDIRITESFPATPASYFSRLHRWVRGDWQNIRFISGKNPLNFVSRYKLIDNLFRSLSTPFCLAAVIVSAFVTNVPFSFAAAVAVLAIILPELAAALDALKKHGFASCRRLYFSGSEPLALSALARAFFSLSFSATESFICVDACFKALWRLLISKKKLLEWTTAATSDASNSLLRSAILSLPSAAAFIILFSSGIPFARLIVVIILFSVPLLMIEGRRFARLEQLSDSGREKLEEYVAAMWQFFEELCNEKSNYLPPDNIQFSPKKAVAKQTSPTNIGLMLLSFLAARDFGFITSQKLAEKLDKSLKTIEKLEKFKGNLYNWYNVTDCTVLSPKFVSTVDSGNFLCCLTALKEGLSEYLPECADFGNIIERISALAESTDLNCLYNNQKNLFHIGIYPESGEKSKSFYDLLMSEARLTSYFAVAKRIVPKKHWAALGRIAVSGGRYCGLVSWSGTAFEYFMPEIFMPSHKGSVSYEALRFSLWCQRKRAGRKPFGFSESGFYAFDGPLNYQYKAHGVQKTGLRRGLNNDFVISPYSSFLMLTTAPQTAIKNLIRLEKLGVYGKYGFFEAVDYTQGRAEEKKPAIIRSFMAHHVGMSFLAADNMLNGRCIQRRFMRDRFMAGASILLEEQNLVNSTVFKDIKHKETPKIREKTVDETVVCKSPDLIEQKVFLYSNGRLTSCMADTGCGYLIYNGTDVTLRSMNPFENPKGIFAVFKTEKEIIPFISALNQDEKTLYEVKFEPDYALYSAKKNNLILKMKCGLSEKENCEIRTFSVENQGNEAVNGEIIIYFEPCLESFDKFSSHPSFSKLFITDKKDQKSNSVVICRENGAEKAAIVCGIKEECEVVSETSREKVLTTPRGAFSLGEKTDFGSKRGNPDCCCAFKINVTAQKGKKVGYTMITAVEETEKEAIDTFIAAKTSESAIKYAKKVPEKGEAEKAVIKTLLPSLVFPGSDGYCKKAGVFVDYSKEDLWSFGISGDLPIIILEITSAENVTQLTSFIKASKKLCSCGIRADTVICYRFDEGYNSEVRQQIFSLLKKENCEQMYGVKGGFFAVNLSKFTPEQAQVLHEASAVRFVDGKKAKKSKTSPKEAFFAIKTQTAVKRSKKGTNVKQCSFTNEKISINNTPSTVDIPWNMVYANQTFGTMVSDKSIGFTWAVNSRENKLTPWYNDTMLDNRGEILFLNYKGCFFDIAALGEAVFTLEKAVWKYRVENILVTLSVTVAERGTAKKISIDMVNSGNEKVDFKAFYYTIPLLSDALEKASIYSAKATENGAVFSNAFSEIRGFSAVQCSERTDYLCFSKADFFSGRFNSSDFVTENPCCALGKQITLNANENKKLDFYFSWAANETAAEKMPFCCNYERKTDKSLKISTPNTNLNLFFNSFLYHQIKHSRFYGRTGPYQCSGAYGFRDQLQDSLAFLQTEPELCRRHILRCCAVQFEEGDVLHWWHIIPAKTVKIKGIRTRCSDDKLWLAYVCAEYVKSSGDTGILSVEVPYIYSEPLSDGENERYETVKRSKKKATVLEHCLKSIENSLRFGENGFPLIGSCDWNDGFSNIGTAEKGESVWLAMFQIIVFESIADICLNLKLTEKAKVLRSAAKKLRQNIEDRAWNGESYARAIMKDGTYIGLNDGFIDLLPQAFSVFAGLKNNRKAIETAYNKLFDKESMVVKLLSPPFERKDFEKTGYIANYPEGIRENGGQYTHAAVWLAEALFCSGMNKEANEIINALNPINRYSENQQAEIYRAEPYVLSGDVYFAENAVGRAGWSHFSGSAAWYYRVIYKNRKKIE